MEDETKTNPDGVIPTGDVPSSPTPQVDPSQAERQRLADMERQLSEKLSKVDAFLAKAEEQITVDNTKFDTTKPRPLNRATMIAYINWLKIHKPKSYEKKKAELEIKLSKLN